jgi:hypothetical protein
MEKQHQTNSKVVITLKNDQVLIKQKRSSAFAFVERSLSLLIGENVPDTLYLGGDRDLVIRYLAHLINTSSFEVDVVDDTAKFINDSDFES